MRRARFLVAASVALAVCSCARDAQYVEQISPPANVLHSDNNRGLFTSRPAAPVYAAQPTQQPAPAPPPQEAATDKNRGLFNSRPAAPVNAAQPAQQPPVPTPPPQQTATDSNRGMFTSRWAAAFDSAQPAADQRPVAVTRVTTTPRPAYDAEVYEQTGSLPSESQRPVNNKRSWFPSSSGAAFDNTRLSPRPAPAANNAQPSATGKTQTAPQSIPASRMYTSSAASAQQAYEQPTPQPQEAPATSNGRGFFASLSTAPSENARPAPRPPPASGMYALSAASAQRAYEQPGPPPQEAPAASNNRGLFNSRSPAPVYAAQPPATGGPYVPPSYASASVSASAATETVYTLGVGDKLRIVVFGQDGISNTYIVDAGGKVNMPLIGAVTARGLTNQQLSDTIAARLKQGYVREPHVTVEVETYRPFFILGEVTTPGQYPYVVNMTAETAVAIAGGFAPRAFKKTVELTRKSGGQQTRSEVPLDYPVRPGDTILVKERWF